MNILRYFLIYKPFGCLSQFSGEAGDQLLGMLADFPKDVYPVGRLDKDSEGLLLLTNDKRLNHALLDPTQGHERTYWVQVDGQIDDASLEKIESGVQIKVGKSLYETKPCVAKAMDSLKLPERNPPIRYRANIPTSWITLTLKEGKNRQVRKMTAKIGFPTLRLVRAGIAHLQLGEMSVGEVRELSPEMVFKGIGLKSS